MSCPHCVTTIAVIESSGRQDFEAMSFEDVVEMEMLGSLARFIRAKHNERAHSTESDRIRATAEAIVRAQSDEPEVRS